MPQDISGNKALLDPSQTTAGTTLQVSRNSAPRSQPAQVDLFADRLMDDLFDDVERLLEGSVPPPPPKRVEVPQRKPIEFTPTPQFSEMIPAPSLPQWNTLIREDSLVVPEINELLTQPPKSAQALGWFQKVLIATLCLSAIAAAGVFLTQRSVTIRSWVGAVLSEPQTAQTVATKPAQADINQQFSDYVQRSLETIDRKIATGKVTPGMMPTPFKSSLPTVPIAKTPSTAIVGPSNSAISSVTSAPSRLPLVINVPPAPAPGSVTVNDPARGELNQLLARLSTVLEKLYPAINRPAIVQQTAPLVTKPVSAPELQRTIRGLIIANDPSQSAALIETNGVTQRYYTGETIGSSGWSIVEIAGKNAVLRRNGELRTLSTGQKF